MILPQTWGYEPGHKPPGYHSFGRAAMRHGVIVLNDPNSALPNTMNKMYFQLFPEQVRPRTLITRDRDENKKFAKAGR